jgi:hypothetical protein
MSKPLLWFVLLFATVSIIGIGATTPLQAQYNAACLDDCPEISTGPLKKTIINIYGCLVRVTWATRNGCNGYRDIVMQKVEFLTPGCASAMSVGAWSNLAQYWLLQQVTGQYIPISYYSNDTCINMRTMKPACWHWDVECEDSVAIPCDSSNCCVTYWRACRDSFGVKRLIRVGDGIVQACDSLWGQPCDFGCDDTTSIIYPSSASGGGPDPMQKAKPIVPPAGDPVGKIGKRPDGLQAVPGKE